MVSIVKQCHFSSVIYTDVLRALNHQLDAHWWEFGTFLYVDCAIMERIRQDKSDVGACMLQLVENGCTVRMELVTSLVPGRRWCRQ